MLLILSKVQLLVFLARGGGKPLHISSLINLKRNKKFPTRTEDEGGADPDLALALALSLSVQQPSQVGLFFCLS